MKYPNFAIALVVGMTLAGLASAGEVYRWVDEEGVTHYSQTPPASDEASRVQVDVPTPPEDEIDRAQKDLEQTARENEESRKERQEAEKRAAEEAEKQAYLEKRCNELRASLQALQQNRRILIEDDGGGRTRLSEEARQKRVEKRRKQIDKECS